MTRLRFLWVLRRPAPRAGLLVLLIGLLTTSGALTSPTAQAADANTALWGPQGSTTTSSAATVRWDNTGNRGAQVVPRDATQRLWHSTGGDKTYADIDPALKDAYDGAFKDLEVTVSQTRDLVGQAVDLTLTGGPAGTSLSPNYFQVMQCSGLVGPDGKSGSATQGPDPARCAFGNGGLGSEGSQLEGRSVARDPLGVGGDWDRKLPFTYTVTRPNPDGTFSDVEVTRMENAAAPFIAASGVTAKVTAGEFDMNNEFYSKATTNAIAAVRFDNTGGARVGFRLDSSLEQPALGCGVRVGQPTGERCWLVVVPRYEGGQRPGGTVSPVAPSIWAQRLQVELNFRPLAGFCPSDGDRVQTAGSELLVSAMASWQPALCDVAKLPTAYTVQGDQEARLKQSSGSQPVILTTAPSEGAVHAPVAVAAPVIAFSIDHKDEAGNHDGPVPRLRLTPRLVAKLLTQSYRSGASLYASSLFDGAALYRDLPWLQDYEPYALTTDPEFVALNPSVPVNFGASGSSLVLENLRSDAAGAVWTWLLKDADAAAFLSGCPDDSGYVVNPFYSTRTYRTCADKASGLEAAARVLREATPTPASYVDGPMTYPGDSASYPQRGWFEGVPKQKDPATGEFDPVKDVNPLTMNDMYPRVGDSGTVAAEAFAGVFRQNTTWCLYQFNSSCTDGRPETKGVWKGSREPQNLGSRFVLGITDSASAARLQLKTAELCTSTDPATCVGANAQTLAAAPKTWATPATAKDAPQQTGAATRGAYPITVPVYAAITPEKLDKGTRTILAGVLDYIATKGQVPGTSSGQLPPGYAPLTSDMVARTKAVATALRTTTTGKTPTNEGTDPSNTAGSGLGGGPAASPPDPGPEAGAGPGATPGAGSGAAPSAAPVVALAKQQQIAEGKPSGRTPLSSGWFSGGLVALLGAGVASAVASPIIERRAGRGSGTT